MPVETLVVKQISPVEESAINTSAAMVAAVESHIRTHIQPRLVALTVVFKGYTGEWRYHIVDDAHLVWDGARLMVRPSSIDVGTWCSVEHCDPRLKILIAKAIPDICKGFTQYLNELLTAQDEKSDGLEAV